MAKTCGWLIAAEVRGVNPISGPNVAMDPDKASSNYHSLPHRRSTTNILRGVNFWSKCCHKITFFSQLSAPPLLSLPYCLWYTTNVPIIAGELGLGWWLKSITGALKTVRLLGQDRNSQDKSRLTNMCTYNCFFIYAVFGAWTYKASVCRPFTPPNEGTLVLICSLLEQIWMLSFMSVVVVLYLQSTLMLVGFSSVCSM